MEMFPRRECCIVFDDAKSSLQFSDTDGNSIVWVRGNCKLKTSLHFIKTLRVWMDKIVRFDIKHLTQTLHAHVHVYLVFSPDFTVVYWRYTRIEQNKCLRCVSRVVKRLACIHFWKYQVLISRQPSCYRKGALFGCSWSLGWLCAEFSLGSIGILSLSAEKGTSKTRESKPILVHVKAEPSFVNWTIEKNKCW